MEFSKEGIMLNKIREIGAYAVLREESIPVWQVRRGFYTAPGDYRESGERFELPLGGHWRCADCETFWFSADVTVPDSFRGRRTFLSLDLGGEGLVRINGEIVSAVTSYKREDGEINRRRVLVSPRAQGGETLRVEVECGLNYMEFMAERERGMTDTEYTVRESRLIALDDEVERYYFDALTAYDAMIELNCDYDRLRRGNVRLPREIESYMTRNARDPWMHDRVREALQASLALVDVDFDREAVVKSIPAASKALKDALAAIDYTPRGQIVFTGNSHIDTAWLWPVRETVRKAAKTFANALSLMDQYPAHVFAHSQPWQYAQVKKYYPELFEKVRRRVKEGRWELVGNAWVEADSNIPSGEALVRQLLYGRAFFMKEFGTCSDVYWMPDVFGYSWALPQIIKRAGMKYFFTSKLINNDINRFPYTLFRWQGVDGTRIPAYLQRMTYNGDISPYFAQFDWQAFDQKNLTDTVLQTYGYGDGGGGPSYQMLERAQRMEHFPGLPDTRIARTEAFYSQVPEDELPVWNDEMYYEFHRGTYTSQAFVKKSNRKGELGLRQAEMASVLAETLCGLSYPMAGLTEAWQTLLLNQFHDIIPGSSIHMVYEDCRRDYARMFGLIDDARRRALEAVSARVSTGGESVVVYNFLSWPRGGQTRVKLDRPAYLLDLPSTLIDDGDGYELSFDAPEIPAMGYMALRLSDRPFEADGALTATATLLENDLLRVTLDGDGIIRSILDKENGREVLSGAGNLLTVFEDKPAGESAWNIDIEYKNKSWTLDRADSVTVVEASAVRACVRVVRSFNKSVITQDIALYPHSRRVDFITHVSWQESEKMLKAAFEADVLAPRVTCEIAYGAIERPTHRNTSWDQAKFEICAHKWADLSEGGYGAALLNDCKYGYDVQDNVMRLTLLRSPVYPDPVADKGEHDFTYAIYPHAGGWREGGVVREAYALNVPLTGVVTGAHAGSLPGSGSFVTVTGEGVVLEAVKRSEDGEGYILRVYESRGGRCVSRVSLGLGVSAVWETNLMEQKERAVPVKDDGFEFLIKPFEIKTFLVR